MRISIAFDTEISRAFFGVTYIHNDACICAYTQTKPFPDQKWWSENNCRYGKHDSNPKHQHCAVVSSQSITISMGNLGSCATEGDPSSATGIFLSFSLASLDLCLPLSFSPSLSLVRTSSGFVSAYSGLFRRTVPLGVTEAVYQWHTTAVAPKSLSALRFLR